MELVTPECFNGLSEEEKQAQLYLAFYTWSDDTDLLDPECFLGYPHRDEAIYAALHIQGGTVDPSCIESLPPEERQLAMYEAVYSAAADDTLTHPDCFPSLSPEVRDLAFYTALYVIAGDVELLSPECFLGSSREEQRAALYAAAYQISNGPTPPADPILELGPIVYYDASSIAGLEEEDLVEVWPDSSFNSNNAVQPVMNGRPMYIPSSTGGLPAVVFDGVDDFMSLTIPADTGRTQFTVIDLAAPPEDYIPIYGHSELPGGYLQAGNWLSSAFSADGYYAGSEWMESGLVINPSSTPSKTVPVILETVTGQTVPFDQITKDRAGGSRVFAGAVSTMVVFDRVLTPGERLAVRSYLSEKYSIPVS